MAHVVSPLEFVITRYDCGKICLKTEKYSKLMVYTSFTLMDTSKSVLSVSQVMQEICV